MRWAVALLTSVLAACSSPSAQIEQKAADLSYTPMTLHGSSFLHRVFLHRPHEVSETIHVYIEHDGVPWVANGTKPSDDPTPRKPVMLELMVMDSAPSIYLGRPCYFGLHNTQNCGSLAWTYGRYSEEVVDSMVSALKKIMADRNAKHLYLFGHSGGGTLAVLIAYRLPEVRAVITLAGNLSVQRWAELHAYAPLEGSMDPMELPPLPATVRQVHYVGSEDTNIPRILAEEYVRSHPGATVIVVTGLGHLCCWRNLWREITASLQAEN